MRKKRQVLKLKEESLKQKRKNGMGNEALKHEGLCICVCE